MDSSPSTASRSSSDDARNRAMGAGIVDDPYPLLHEMRAACPVQRGSVAARLGVRPPVTAEGGEVCVLTHDEGLQVLRDTATFSSHFYEAALGDNVGRALIGLDPPEHQRHRSLLQPAFSQREMEWWETDIVRPIVRSYLDPLVQAGRGDLYADFAAHVPIHVTAVAIGLPPGDIGLFVEWAVTMTSPVESPEARVGASRAVEEYIRPLVTDRRAAPRRDLLSLLVQAQVPDDEEVGVARDPLSDQELVDFVRLLIVAGASTVYRAYGVLLYGLLSDPRQLDAVRADRALIPQAIEESLRWEQPVTGLSRLCTKPATVGGVDVRQGDTVTVEIGAVNHDPSVWPDPDRFDIFRDPHPHLSFGFGRHRCLGIHLARMELEVMLAETLDHFPGLALDPSAVAPHLTGLVFRMVTGLPVTWQVPDTSPAR